MNNEPFQTQPLHNDDGRGERQPAEEPVYNDQPQPPAEMPSTPSAQFLTPPEDEPIYSPRYRPPPAPVYDDALYAPPSDVAPDPLELGDPALLPAEGVTQELPGLAADVRRARRVAYLERMRRAASYAGLQSRAFATQVRARSARAGSAFNRSPVGRYMRDNVMLAVAVGCLLLTMIFVLGFNAISKRSTSGTATAIAGVPGSTRTALASRGATAIARVGTSGKNNGGLGTPGPGETVEIGVPTSTFEPGIPTPTLDLFGRPTVGPDGLCPDGSFPEFEDEPCPQPTPGFGVPTDEAGIVIFPSPTLWPTFPTDGGQPSDPIPPPPTFAPIPTFEPVPTPDTGGSVDCSGDYPDPDECGDGSDDIPTDEPEDPDLPTPINTFGPVPTSASGRATTTRPATTTAPQATPTAGPPTATSTPAASATPSRPPAIVLTGNRSWTLANSPVILAQDYQLASGASLTIDPGVEVRISSGVRFLIDGTLSANGVAGSPVRFVSADGGLWSAISVRAGGRADLVGVEVRGAGAEGAALISQGGTLVVRAGLIAESAAAITAYDSNVEIRNTLITGNDLRTQGAAVGIILGLGNSVILTGNNVSGNRVSEGASGVKILVNGRLTSLAIEGNLIVGTTGTNLVVEAAEPYRASFTCNTFSGGAIGLNLRTSQPSLDGFAVSASQNVFQSHQQRGAAGDLAFDLTNNWWGDASGPYEGTRNPSGTGDAVGPNLLFSPWLTSRPGCAPQ